ncbi:hypothetical protein K1719_003362 [Acacia pycnantha]|nr:hypothetical protein K1719_003362 [Acacia pycnantha]
MSAFEERPLVEHDQDFYEYEQEGGWCGCFRPAFGYRWRRLWPEDDNDGGGGGGWVMNKLRKMKEASEVIGGPKWKTFIRKIIFSRKQKNRFQYDEHSYALNFDKAQTNRCRTNTLVNLGQHSPADGEEGNGGFTTSIWTEEGLKETNSSRLGSLSSGPLF